MISPESPPQRRPKPIAATCARQQNENTSDTKQSSQKTQLVGGSCGRRGGSGHIRSQAGSRGGYTTVLPMRRGRVSGQVRRGSAKARRANRPPFSGRPHSTISRPNVAAGVPSGLRNPGVVKGMGSYLTAPQKKRTCLRPLQERAVLVARKTHAPAGEGHQQPPHTMGDVRPHGSGRARPVLRRGYAPDGRVHSLCTLRIPVICVRGDAVQAMNGV